MTTADRLDPGILVRLHPDDFALVLAGGPWVEARTAALMVRHGGRRVDYIADPTVARRMG